ncbi:MAG TPA: histidine kinase [Casimicrobium sp.]|nr:histidine kinase [Burkholderiales bacterium]HPG60488.1 histidine kinase [Casimicrobium sp.]
MNRPRSLLAPSERSGNVEARNVEFSRHWRWLFAVIPLALALAVAAAWLVPDIAFFEAWPALNVLFFLVGLAILPVFSPNASLSRKLIHISVFAPIAAVFIAVLIGAALDRYYGNDLQQTFYLRFQTMLVAGLSAGLLYAAVVGAIVYLRAQRVAVVNKLLTTEVKESDIQRQLTETRLRMLQAQIEPHFLFNTLASAQQLAQKGAPDAAKLIGHLVRFLRMSIPSMRDDKGALKREFEQISAYLAIMQTRMGGRLSFSVSADASVEQFALPPALVMTLAENAIKHGIEPAADGGRIDITAKVDGNTVVVTVADTGVGFVSTDSKDAGGGLGLSNIAQRLQAIYGDAAKVKLMQNTPHGCIATLSLPLGTS